MAPRWVAAFALTASAAVALTCGGPTSPNLERGPLRFTAAPIVMGPDSRVWQMGYDWVGDIWPYVLFDSSRGPATDEARAVFAPAPGAVTEIRPTPFSGTTLYFNGAGGYRFYLTGLETTRVTVGQTVPAGERVGTRPFTKVLASVGLGVIDPNMPEQFAEPARYAEEVRYAKDPLDFFTRSLRDDLRAKLRQPATGFSVSYDLAGTLQGNWYRSEAPIAGSGDREMRDTWLRFYYTEAIPASIKTLRIAFVDMNGTEWTTDYSTGPLPRDVTPATGLVRYEVFPGGKIFLLVQMLDARTVRFETFDAYYTSDPKAFTANARTYVR